MVWQGRKYFFVLLMILFMLKVVLRYHVGSSVKILSFILKIFIGYVAKLGSNKQIFVGTIMSHFATAKVRHKE